MHPRFLELAKVAVNNGHYIQTCTNFSKPLWYWEELVDIAKDKLYQIQISYHPTQISNKSEFIAKIKQFNKLLHKNTKFILSAVLSEENYDDIVQLRDNLKDTSMKLELQHIRNEKGEYLQYSQKLQNFIDSSQKVEGLDKIYNNKSFGISCSTGKNFITIGINGDVFRCYAHNNHLNNLGNITKEFYLYKTNLPCIVKQCHCTLPYLHGCLNFTNRNPLKAKVLSRISKYSIVKNVLRNKHKLKDSR